MKAKRFKLKDGYTKDDILVLSNCPHTDGSDFITKGADFHIWRSFENKELSFYFSILIAFKKKLSDWNDLDCILILDDNWCQPYTPFYRRFGEDVIGFPALEYVIEEYNHLLSNLEFLEELPEETNGNC